MADVPFASPKRRLARAKQHVENIEVQVVRFFDSEPYAKVVERNNRGFDEYKVKLVRAIPDDITDLAYEAIEALRSVLDQSIYAVAEAKGGIERLDLLHFPIANELADFENLMRGRVKDLPPDILTLLRSFKSYKGGNDLIWALNRIRRESTHRLIVPAATVLNSVRINRVAMSGPWPLDIPPPKWDGEKNEIIFIITGPGAELDYDVEFAFFIAFGEVEGLAGEPVVGTLQDTVVEIERMLTAMETESRRIGLVT